MPADYLARLDLSQGQRCRFIAMVHRPAYDRPNDHTGNQHFHPPRNPVRKDHRNVAKPQSQEAQKRQQETPSTKNDLAIRGVPGVMASFLADAGLGGSIPKNQKNGRPRRRKP
jgi:hypothetical protein